MAHRHHLKPRSSGFTLIELMITIVIVAILLAVALPAFRQQVIRGHRAAAQAEMLDIANRQEQYLIANRSYMDATILAATGYTLEPEVASDYNYSIVVGAGASPTYVLTFTAIGGQVSDGNMTLNEQGVGTPADYWKR